MSNTRHRYCHSVDPSLNVGSLQFCEQAGFSAVLLELFQMIYKNLKIGHVKLRGKYDTMVLLCRNLNLIGIYSRISQDLRMICKARHINYQAYNDVKTSLIADDSI